MVECGIFILLVFLSIIFSVLCCMTLFTIETFQQRWSKWISIHASLEHWTGSNNWGSFHAPFALFFFKFYYNYKAESLLFWKKCFHFYSFSCHRPASFSMRNGAPSSLLSSRKRTTIPNFSWLDLQIMSHQVNFPDPATTCPPTYSSWFPWLHSTDGWLECQVGFH